MGRWSQEDVDRDNAIELGDDAVVDLRDDITGRPGHCPACAEPGYLDRIDPRAGLQLEHCRSCGCCWNRSIEDPAQEIEITYLPKR